MLRNVGVALVAAAMAPTCGAAGRWWKTRSGPLGNNVKREALVAPSAELGLEDYWER